MLKTPISSQDFIAGYYKGLKDGSTSLEVSQALGLTINAFYQRVADFKKKTGKALPKLKIAERWAGKPSPETPVREKRSYTPRGRPEMPAEQFVRLWQTATNMRELCEKNDLDPGSCRRRVNKLRKLGVPLKKFPGSEKLDIAGLIALAQSLSPAEPVQ